MTASGARSVRRSRRRRRTPELLAGFWFVTSLVAIGGIVLAAVLVTVDKLAGEAGVFPALAISPDSARTILGSIAGSLITIASLTSSLTIVTLQLLSSQYTPRSVRGFLTTRLSQFVLGTFIGVFLYCLVVLVVVREPGDENRPFVPSLSLLVAVLLAVGGLATLVAFIHAMSQTIQVSTMTARIARDTVAAIRRLHDAPPTPLPGDDPAGEVVRIRSNETGYIRDVDLTLLADEGARRLPGPAVVRVVALPGDFVTPASVLAHVVTGPDVDAGSVVGDAVRLAVNVQRERDLRTDPAYGIRQLVDIALRALSPGINDPSTAVTCIGYLRALLEDLAGRDLDVAPVARVGQVVAVGRPQHFDHYLLPLTEVVVYARDDTRVVLALLTALAGVAGRCVDTARRGEVLALHEEIRAAAMRGDRLGVERHLLAAAAPDAPARQPST